MKKETTRKIARWTIFLIGLLVVELGFNIATAAGLFGFPIRPLEFTTPFFQIAINNPRVDQGVIMIAVGLLILYLSSKVETKILRTTKP
jgi:hypothetical protein